MTLSTAWLFLRVLRFGFWLATAVYYFMFAQNQAAYLTPFGHLMTRTELWMFGLPLAAIFLGFMELMTRERAGLPRPAIGRDWTTAR
jgi:hypothetical protein